MRHDKRLPRMKMNMGKRKDGKRRLKEEIKETKGERNEKEEEYRRKKESKL